MLERRSPSPICSRVKPRSIRFEIQGVHFFRDGKESFQSIGSMNKDVYFISSRGKFGLFDRFFISGIVITCIHEAYSGHILFNKRANWESCGSMGKHSNSWSVLEFGCLAWRTTNFVFLLAMIKNGFQKSQKRLREVFLWSSKSLRCYSSFSRS